LEPKKKPRGEEKRRREERRNKKSRREKGLAVCLVTAHTRVVECWRQRETKCKVKRQHPKAVTIN
jgi:hypothetical protein